MCETMQIKCFHELSLDQLYQIIKLRINIFSVEQCCCYADLDDLDQQAWHIFDYDEQVTAYARIVKPGIAYGEDVCIGRVACIASMRGEGLGKKLMETAINFCKKQFPNVAISISAQSYLSDFYQKLGFVNAGSFYLEDDIPHQHMRLL